MWRARPSSDPAPPPVHVGLAGDRIRRSPRRGDPALRSGGWSRETTVATYSVRGSVNRISLDLGAADAEIVGAATARRRGPAHRPLRVRPARVGRAQPQRPAGDPLALPQDVFSVCTQLPAHGARQRRVTQSDDVRRALHRLSRLGAGRHDTGDIAIALCGLRCAPAPRPARSRPARRARWSDGASLAHRRRARHRPARPLPGRRRHRCRPAHGTGDRHRGRAVQIQTLSSAGDVTVEASG